MTVVNELTKQNQKYVQKGWFSYDYYKRLVSFYFGL